MCYDCNKVIETSVFISKIFDKLWEEIQTWAVIQGVHLINKKDFFRNQKYNFFKLIRKKILNSTSSFKMDSRFWFIGSWKLGKIKYKAVEADMEQDGNRWVVFEKRCAL